MSKILIRFNTDKDKIDSSLKPWRVIIDGKEFFADKVTIKTEVQTSKDELASGLVKWHISCSGQANWDETHQNCTIS